MRFARPVPSLVAVVLLLCAGASLADVRTRELSATTFGADPALVARTTGEARVHALVRLAPGGRSEAGRAGMRLLRPVGEGWWIAAVTRTALAAVGEGHGVEAAAELRSSDRVAPELARRVAEATARDAAWPLRVKIFPDAPFDAAREAVERAGATVTRALDVLGVLDVVADPTAVARLSSLESVRWIEAAPPAPQVANNGMRFDAHVNQPQNLGLGGAGVMIGMWDDGMPDATHPDLAGRVVAGEAGLFTTQHSTHVAGIAIGDGTNSLSHGGTVRLWRGVATSADIVAYNLFDALSETASALSTWDIDLSTNSWVAIVDSMNCALYGDYSSDAPEYDAIVRGIYGKALPVVFAAGNERDDADCAASAPGGYGTLPPPATAKNVISVGASLSDTGLMTPFSSWGPTDDGRMKPDLSAPGCQLSQDFGITSTTVAGNYVALCGTSQSAPAVTGSMALLLGDWRAFHVADPRPATYKALLGGFAQDRGPAGPDYRFGLGALNAEAAVRALRTSTTVEDDVDDAGVDEWTFFVPAGTDTLRVTLVWDDPPAAELALTTLVNDLDLELVDPSSLVRLPFVLDPATPSAPATTGVNHRDNVEQVRVLAPPPGTWIARVRGTSVPDGPQEYSLVGFDRLPPADPASLAATAVDDTTVAVTWIRPGDADRAGTLVVRSPSPVVWSPADGTSYGVGTEPAGGVFVVAADDADHSVTPLVDAPLAPGTVWHYATFSYDGIPNYSPGVADTAQTSAVAVSVPVSAAARRILFARAGANPTGGASTFRLELPERTAVEVSVYDALGRRVTTLVRGERDAGSHVLAWDGRDARGAAVAGGVYFVRLRTSDVTLTEKILRVR